MTVAARLGFLCKFPELGMGRKMRLNLQSRMLPYIWGPLVWVSPKTDPGPSPDSGGVFGLDHSRQPN